VASDSFLLPEFVAARTNIFNGRDGSSGGPEPFICEVNIGFFYAYDWLNYTRVFPAGTYNVWGRLAAGAGAFDGCTLSMVTSGVGTSNQVTQVLGSFSDPNPAGWQSYHWIQLSDTNGNPVYLQLNGQATLRLTAPTNAASSGNGLNPLFFMLTPAVQPVTFNISAIANGNSLQISIPTHSGNSYQIYSATSLSGPWTPLGGSIPGDGTVHIVPESETGAQNFYRVQAH
jgi:hypothetical protein